VLCRSAAGARLIVRLPRSGEHWDPWAATPGGALLAAYLAGAYRDMVVPLEMAPFDKEERAPESGTAATRRLEPVGYLPTRRRPPQRGGGGPVQCLRRIGQGHRNHSGLLKLGRNQSVSVGYENNSSAAQDVVTTQLTIGAVWVL
jgi:hypothetical protein